ncbi:MAG: hypothetical protein C0482_10015 [Gordonia sp.]|nr:hypothetical protein [Gordonia sp. (in: high G+C Gram-positive bacteria)]
MSDVDDDRFEHHLEFRLSKSAGTRTLMRMVSMLHSRGAEVTSLRYSGPANEEAFLLVTVRTTPARARVLALTFDRAVEVLDSQLVTQQCKSA